MMTLAGVLCLEGQTVPKLTLGASPSQEITLTPFNAAEIPAFSKVLNIAPQINGLQNAGFVVSNNSKRTIIGIGVQWSILDKNGQRTVRNSQSHSFFTSRLEPLADAGQRLIVLPQMFIQEPKLQSTGMVVSSPSSRLAAQFSSAAEVHAEIDSIIFGDGEIVGPNKLRLHAEIMARKDAADIVIRQVHTAAAIHLQKNNHAAASQEAFEREVQEFIGQVDGKLPPDHPFAGALRELTKSHTPGPVARQTTSFAWDLLSTRYFRIVFMSIQKAPSPPAFYRKDGQQL